jgi:DNA-binding MarR family transcriptional regulator/predicted GNAT family N-acyltransferase
VYLASLAELALGSRLKSLSDQFYAAVDEAYRACGAPIESRWFPLMRYLWERGAAPVTEVAAAIGQTHSAVSQLCGPLARAGLLARQADPGDGRRSLLSLTARGRAAMAGMGRTWCAVRRGVAASLGPQAETLLAALAQAEAALRERPLAPAILAEHAALMGAELEIVPFEPALRGHFRRLNLQWLERDFVVEDVDRAMLDEPERVVLAPGGAIFFARLAGEVIGTCALLRESPGVYELSKMGVDESFRGLGAGRRLLDAAIAEFRRRRGRTLFLESSSKLRPALHMYEQAGFVLQPGVRPGSHYARADVYMVYAPPVAAKPRRKRKPAS